MRVLIVSENAAERDRAASMLRSRPGVEVIDARSAAEAKQAMVDGQLDVLVVDGNLSPQGGFSFLYEARLEAVQSGFRCPPCIVLTARVEDDWLASWAQADATLPLPADPFAVAQAVDRLVAV